MKRIELPEKELQKLYLEEEFSSNQIADEFDCSKRTVLKRLREYDIPRRSSGPERRDDLTEEKLRKLYIEERLSTRDIAEKLDTGRSTVYRKLKKFDISTRDIAESHIKHDRKSFTGDSTQKSYIKGFSIGDLRVRKIGEKSKTIKVDCGSTRKEQIELIEDIFSDYGKIWKGGPYDEGKIQIEAFLDESFSFLLDARNRLEELPHNDNDFLAFLSGFIDAEGSFFVTDGKARFSLGNYDKELLKMLKSRLKDVNVQTTQIYEDNEKHEIEREYTRNDSYNLLQINKMDDLLKLIELIEPYIKHENRRKQMSNVLENISGRTGDEISCQMKLKE